MLGGGPVSRWPGVEHTCESWGCCDPGQESGRPFSVSGSPAFAGKAQQLRPVHASELAMPANVEIKARVRDLAQLLRNAERASGSPGCVIAQTDTFFSVPCGRLKLRDFRDGRGQLIFYDRPNLEGPKLSQYAISPTDDPAGLVVVLQEQQSPQDGEQVARQLMEDLGVREEDLLTGAYLDFLLARAEARP
ncbi:uncharacterized protein LOC128327725 isoform X2 [Hemicordylus capensis]|uniref:uncharacterized protein LOC128327725 isoform X2 n=1 Tax=Hemicordylus capensis TaxID=884348 RepID=UPI00230431AA|nr:uncharacterized protein LOC128327725 isoform X2 [Hemicordylus capensis]